MIVRDGLLRTALTAGLALLAGCVPMVPQQPPAPVPQPETKPAPVERPPSPPRRSSKPLPIPERPLEVNADCRYRDDVGTEGKLVLDVQESKVERFASEVDMGRRGRCRFDLSAFEQVAWMPTPTLVAGDCTVRMWEQGDQVTVSYQNCAGNCTSGAHEYLWPTLVSRKTGTCR